MITTTLRDGVEDVYSGDVIQEWLAGHCEKRKVLEHEPAVYLSLSNIAD